MGLLLKMPLAQSKYIQPEAKVILTFAEQVKGGTLGELVRQCLLEEDRLEEMVQELLGDTEQGSGECFGKSIVLCSLLRALGYSERICWVVISCHYSENFGEATHATVLIEEQGQWFILDLTQDQLDEAVLAIPSILEFTTHNRAICLFNDQHGLIADGDGIIAELPMF